jgi:ParB family chromosome partitioning protein
MSTPKQNKDLIGKGLRSLLQNIDSDLKTTAGSLKTEVVEKVTHTSRIPLSDIQINPKQPRRDFDENSLNELAASIKLHDIIQPITVSKLAGGKYQLIAGERRFRASKIAGLTDVPAYVRQANDQQLLELALLENLQREDLNAVEIAISYKRRKNGQGTEHGYQLFTFIKITTRYSAGCSQRIFKHGPCKGVGKY